MKWNMLLGTMVLGLGLCTQSFGFDLLDRMLGVNGGATQKCGCDGKGAHQKGDCDACQKGHGGLFGGHGACQKGDGKGCGDACQKDGCGDACQKGGKGHGRMSMLDSIFGCNKCCDSCKGGKGDACQKDDGCKGDACQKDGCGDACQKDGCGDACQKDGCKDGACQKDGCGDACQKDGCKDGACQKDDGCKDGACQKDGDVYQNGKDGAQKDTMKADAPVPPAPVVDPSAFLNSKRTVIQASVIR